MSGATGSANAVPWLFVFVAASAIAAATATMLAPIVSALEAVAGHYGGLGIIGRAKLLLRHDSKSAICQV